MVVVRRKQSGATDAARTKSSHTKRISASGALSRPSCQSSSAASRSARWEHVRRQLTGPAGTRTRPDSALMEFRPARVPQSRARAASRPGGALGKDGPLLRSARGATVEPGAAERAQYV